MSDFFNSTPAAPTLAAYQQPSINSALSQFLSQQGQLPGLQSFANQVNQGANSAYQGMVFGTSPTLQSNLNQFGLNTQSLLAGQIPTDVAQQTQDNAAYQSLIGGFGGSNMAHALTARDLGQTSLSLQQQGASNLSQQQGLAQALNPSNMTTSGLFYSPQTILSSDQQQALINNQIGNQNSIINYQNQLQSDKGSPFDQMLTNNLASLLGQVTNPETALSSVMSVENGGYNAASANPGASYMGIPSGGMASTGTYAVDPATGQNIGSPTPGSGSGATGASPGGGGGAAGIMGLMSACCFIFLESLNGELPWYARKARDTRGNNATVRGYRWMSRWLVPAMRVWEPVKSLVNFFMVKPMLMVGEDYYTEKKSVIGKSLKPVVAFWLTTWTLLGLTVGSGERGRDATT